MPIYEYECTKCGDQSEVWQKFSEPPLTRCDKCRGKMRKNISQSSFHLKGTGWYVTDYTSNRGENAGKSEKSEGDTSTKEVKSSKDESKKEDSSSSDTKTKAKT